MKVQFSKCVDYVPEWNGNKSLPESERVKSKLTVLHVGDLLELMDEFQKQGLGGKVDSNKVNVRPILSKVTELFPKYIILSNLLDDDGKPVPMEEITSDPRYMGLTGELVMQLVNISSPAGDDEKNLNAPRS